MFEINLLSLILILISVILLLILVISIFFVFKLKTKSNKRTNDINSDSKNLEVKLDEINDLKKKYLELNDELKNNINKYTEKYLSNNNLTKDDLFEILFLDIESFYTKKLRKQINEFKNKNDEELRKISSNILINSMEQVVYEIIDKSSNLVDIDESIKGKIIGKDGRIIKAFEKITNVNLSIEKDSQAKISCFNPLRREIGIRVLKKLIKLRYIEIDKIEQVFKEESKNIHEEMIEIGREIIEDKLNLKGDVPHEIYYYVGRMKYRNSYGQPLLIHSLECAKIASLIAKEIGVDTKKAKIASFFHDIGKTIDYEGNNDHVESGVNLAKKYNLDEYIINAIESHHGKVYSNNIYSSIAKVADIISASRPGVRMNNKTEIFEISNEIEKICKGFNGVQNAHVIKSAREVKIIIDPNLIDDIYMEILATQIEDKLFDNPITQNRSIKLIFSRENILETKTKIKRLS